MGYRGFGVSSLLLSIGSIVVIFVFLGTKDVVWGILAAMCSVACLIVLIKEGRKANCGNCRHFKKGDRVHFYEIPHGRCRVGNASIKKDDKFYANSCGVCSSWDYE